METVKADDVVWKLEDLYQAPEDPNIEADRRWCLEQAAELANKWKGRVKELEAGELMEAIRSFENLRERAQKLLAYGYLLFATQTHDPRAGSLWQSLQEFYSIFRRDTLFFELEWIKTTDERARTILENPEMDVYRHYLEALRRYKPHMLSETEERILAEKEPVETSAWSTLFDKVLSQMRFGDRQRTESEVLSELYHPQRDVRKHAAMELTDGLEGMLHVLTHIFNTTILDKNITDRLRKHPHWLHARNLSNEADDTMVEALIEAVTSRYETVRRYYRLKRELLHYDKLYDYDRYAPIPGLPEKVFEWEEARDIVLAAYEDFSPRMAEIARTFFQKGWIHAPIRPGKRSGAFAHPTVPLAHPYVFLNFTGTHRDVMTLAHELGHGVHQYLARKQGLLNSETPLTTAESASVFGEMLVFRYLLGQIKSPRERLALLCTKLEDIFATVFRQVSMNRFEDAIHNERQRWGELDRDRLSELWLRTQRAMFGDSVELLDHYRIWWSYIPHFVHSPGYVYAYAFGELLVLALYQKYQEDGAVFVPLYLQLLEAGGKASPNELLHPFGIDLAKPGFWHLGLRALESLVDEAEKEFEGLKSKE